MKGKTGGNKQGVENNGKGEEENSQEFDETETENSSEIQLTEQDLESVYPLIVFGFIQIKEIFNMILGMLGTIKELLIVETLLNIVE